MAVKTGIMLRRHLCGNANQWCGIAVRIKCITLLQPRHIVPFDKQNVLIIIIRHPAFANLRPVHFSYKKGQNDNTKPALTLAVALMMFPQIAETIYSPALTDIAQGFGVSAAQAGQTLSCTFRLRTGVVTGDVYVISPGADVPC